MNKKLLLKLLFLLTLPIATYAHTLLLNVFNNEDNTITIEGVFNTGQLAAGAQVRLEALASGEVLYKKRLPDEGEITIKIPKEQYQVVLDGGPGHQIVENGPEPLNGFTKKTTIKKEAKLSEAREGNKPWSIALIVTISLAFVLLLSTIYISIKNTNKLMKELKA